MWMAGCCMVPLLCSPAMAQTSVESASVRDINYYLNEAYTQSPFIQEQTNLQQIEELELEKLRALYTRSRLEATGDYLFVPIVSRENGTTTFEWNAQEGSNYYGYDLGTSSGHLQAGVTLTQPLTGGSLYRAARLRNEIDREQHRQQIKLQKHELQRAVVEQYLLCLSDRASLSLCDSVEALLQQQQHILRGLAQQALIPSSRLELIEIEMNENEKTALASRASYHTHLCELNILCGVTDTTLVTLQPLHLTPSQPSGTSSFLYSYQLDSLAAEIQYKYDLQIYRPRLNLFADGGLRSLTPSHTLRRWGVSAGLTLSWLLYDGGQKKMRYHQMQALQATTTAYRHRQELSLLQRQSDCRSRLDNEEKQLQASLAQLARYRILLAQYEKEMATGTLSIIDYITLLKSYLVQQRDYSLLVVNKELIINALNYWMWSE